MSTNIQADELILGKNTYIEPTAIIRGINGRAKRIKIGDNCYIGTDVQIICDDFELGDYAKIQHHCNIHGYLPCHIGHNAWIGQYTIIDSIGGMSIGNNCGIGAHSQLWSHIKYGDTLEGCRFLSDKKMIIGNDVWFVGHCIVSPITAKDKSMAMAGSVVTRDMEFNEIYAGTPAKSISHKVGGQFKDVSVSQKLTRLKVLLANFQGGKSGIHIVDSVADVNFEDKLTYFDVSTRQYKKTGSTNEVAFMRYLLPDKAKFIPFENV